ncbi:malic enzyme, N-terminal domain protein, partial [Vibrio parahaemolyticus VP2007-007]
HHFLRCGFCGLWYRRSDHCANGIGRDF